MITLHTNHGDIRLKLFFDKAPQTAENFLQYCRDGHYNGTLFHRVINGFMVQGGGYTAGFKEKATRDPIKNEADNGLSNKVGTVAMARTMAPHSATAQFFINVNDNNFLDFTAANTQGYGYCVFGEVIEGMDVVNHIKAVQTTSNEMGHDDVPTQDVIIENVSIAQAVNSNDN